MTQTKAKETSFFSLLDERGSEAFLAFYLAKNIKIARAWLFHGIISQAEYRQVIH